MLFCLGGKHENYQKTLQLLFCCRKNTLDYLCCCNCCFFLFFDRTDFVTLLSSLIGVTSLIFNAKGNPIGQALMIVFSLMYGYISFRFSYYGEMMTYLCMTMPMAVFALISWLKNPFKGNKSEVKVNRISKLEFVIMMVAAAAVTVLFFFILRKFNTSNIIPSTISVTTSFIAVYLTFRRSPLFALGYASNDIVLIVLWVLAMREKTSYASVVVCFTAFLVNDFYGYLNWKRMEKRQSYEACAE